MLSYAAIGCFTFWLYSFGPAVTLLRAELGFSYSILGLYSVLWSAGAVVTGAIYTGLARRVSALDGQFSVASPAGGPTTIAAVLPCA